MKRIVAGANAEQKGFVEKAKLLSEFQDKSADFINGRLSPIAFDKWFVEVSHAIAQSARKEERNRCYKLVKNHDVSILFRRELLDKINHKS